MESPGGSEPCNIIPPNPSAVPRLTARSPARYGSSAYLLINLTCARFERTSCSSAKPPKTGAIDRFASANSLKHFLCFNFRARLMNTFSKRESTYCLAESGSTRSSKNSYIPRASISIFQSIFYYPNPADTYKLKVRAIKISILFFTFFFWVFRCFVYVFSLLV